MRKLTAVLLLACVLALIAMAAPGPKPEAKPSPPITREVLEKRLEELKQGRDQAVANVHAFDGAIAECQFWMKQLPEQSPPQPTTAK